LLQCVDASLCNFIDRLAPFRLDVGQLYRMLSADAEKEILVVVVSLVVHCCTIKKNVIVASQLYDVANVQFTVWWTE